MLFSHYNVESQLGVLYKVIVCILVPIDKGVQNAIHLWGGGIELVSLKYTILLWISLHLGIPFCPMFCFPKILQAKVNRLSSFFYIQFIVHIVVTCSCLCSNSED